MNLGSRMATVLDRVMTAAFERVHTCVPAKVETYDAAARKCTAKPLIRLRLSSGPTIDIPPISGVPVMFPASAAFALTYPIAQGDVVLLLFSEASLGNWLKAAAGETVDPEDASRFSLSDAIAIPGIYPFADVPESKNTIDVAEDGTLTLKNSGGNEVVLGGSSVTINGNFEVLQ